MKTPSQRQHEEAKREQEREIELWEAVAKSGLVENGRMKNADAD